MDVLFNRYGLFIFVAMYRLFRLSTHRKNEFRKRRVEQSRCVVTTETLRVEQASQQHNLSQSLPGDNTKMQLVVNIPQESGCVAGPGPLPPESSWHH